MSNLANQMLFFFALSVIIFFSSVMVFTTIVEQQWILFTNGPDLSQLAGLKSKLVIIDYSKDGTAGKEFKREELEPLKKEGNKILAYLNIGIAENWRFYWKTLDKSLLISPLDGWSGEYYVKYWEGSWFKVLNEYMKRINLAGFDGAMLDWINVFEHSTLKNKSNKSGEELEKSMAELVKKLSAEFNTLEFALVNGEKLILDYPDVLKTGNIKYIVVESLFFKNQRLDNTSRSFLERLDMLLKVQSKGVQILSVEYIDNGNPLDKSNSDRIKNYISLAKKYNFLYYVARIDMKLNTLNIPRIMD